MDRRRAGWTYAILVIVMMVAPVFPGWAEDGRAPPKIVWTTTTFADGSSEKTFAFAEPGSDGSLSVSLPNGAKVLKAGMNVTNGPFTEEGNDYPDNVSIDFGQDGVNEWEFNAKGGGSFGRQLGLYNASGPVSYSKVNFKAAGTDKTTKIRLPKAAVVDTASLNVSVAQRLGTPGKILVIYADYPYYGWKDDLVNRLKAFSTNFTKVDDYNGNQGTPTWDYIKDYSAILIYSDSWNGYGFQSAVNMGNLMADYVDAGGALVTFMGVMTNGGQYYLQGRFNPNYYAMTPGNYHYGYYTGWTVTSSGHPVMDGVNSLYWPNGPCYMSNQGSTPAGASVIAKYTANNWAMVSEKNVNGVNRVDVNFFPFHYNYYYIGYYGDGDKLMRNALLYAGPTVMNIKVDVANDGSIDYSNASMAGSTIISGFADQLNDYLSDATTSYTDSFGNEFVDIPVAITSASGGNVNISQADVTYSLRSKVDVNPSTGNLAGALNALISPKADGGTTDIVMLVNSGSAGKLTVSDLVVEWQPPDHWATIDSRTPDEDSLEMYENSSMEFCITVSDAYNYPLNVTWYMNSMVIIKKVYNMTYVPDFDANGTYNVTVKVDNGLHQTITFWKLLVKNTNRRPVVDSVNPPDIVEMSEASSTLFEVAASDPDGDPLNYTWFVDNRQADAYEVQFEYFAGYSAAGQHAVKAVVRDDGGLNASAIWTVTVLDVNAAPDILDSYPTGDEVVMSENEARKFSVVDYAIDGDKLTDIWYLDGVNTGINSRSYNYTPDYNSSGHHILEVDISDGKLSVKRMWDITVNDLNRPPIPIIDSPRSGTEYMLWDELTFTATPTWDPDNDELNLTWSEGKKVYGYGTSLTVHLTRGKHLVTLTANDGKKNGIATTTVEVTVRYIEFDALIYPDIERPTVGKTIKLMVQLTNRGDGYADLIPVYLYVDGVNASSLNIEAVEPDKDFGLEFPWKAVKGTHKLEIKVLDQSFSKSVTATTKPVVAPDTSWYLPLGIIVAIVAAVGLGAFVFMNMRRRSVAPAGGMVAEPGAYGAYAAAPAYAAAAAPSAYEAAQAQEAVKGTEKVLQEAERIGLDTSKARQTFKVAQNFNEMGKYTKAIQYCKNAEGLIE